MRMTLAVLALATAATPLAAQTEDELRAYFEGKSVRIKIEMPGSSEGVDVFPGTAQPVDFPKLASRLKRFGTAIYRGQEVLITKLKLKNDHIEFQLGGGGYGTFGDNTSPNVSIPSAPKSGRERTLEEQIPKTSDVAEKRRMQSELNDLRNRRNREDARNRAEAAQATAINEANIRQRRLEGGSRFNIQYERNVPSDALTPESVMRALGEYVDFSPMSGGPVEAPRGSGELRKGLTVEEVDAMLGRPESISTRKEGTLSVSTSSYRTRDRRVTAEFVEGVLIRFTMTSP